MPHTNTEAMNGHHAEIALNVARVAHAVVLIDGAGWHTSKMIATPASITLLKLPVYCPELNAQENIWRYMRQKWLSNPIFAHYAAIRKACCNAWNNLIADPKRISSNRNRDWATISQNL